MATKPKWRQKIFRYLEIRQLPSSDMAPFFFVFGLCFACFPLVVAAQRELAARQQQAATAFRQVIRHSLGEDYANNALLDHAQQTSSPAGDGVSPSSPFPKNQPRPGDVRRDGGGDHHQSRSSRTTNDDVESDRQSRSNCTIDDVASDHQSRSSRTDDVASDHHHRRSSRTVDDVASNTGTTIGAACALASALSRLASRHRELAFGLLDASQGHGEIDPRSFAMLPEEMALLGQSVGLQASAVGLMDEVVARTVHSRVRRDGPWGD